MKFKLNKNISRRRRLAAGDGKTKGDDGTFGFNMRSGKCVKKNADDTACAQYEDKAAGEGFALVLSLLALFALY